MAAFRATLEEVTEADLLLHVIDASHPERDRQVAAVRRVLSEVGAEDVEIIEVYNKVDAIDAAAAARITAQFDTAVLLSARTGAGIDALLDRMAAALGLDVMRVTLSFDAGDPSDRARIAQLYRVGLVISQTTSGGRTMVEADVPRRLRDRLLGASR